MLLSVFSVFRSNIQKREVLIFTGSYAIWIMSGIISKKPKDA